jgi:hypothetical protein
MSLVFQTPFQGKRDGDFLTFSTGRDTQGESRSFAGRQQAVAKTDGRLVDGTGVGLHPCKSAPVAVVLRATDFRHCRTAPRREARWNRSATGEDIGDHRPVSAAAKAPRLKVAAMPSVSRNARRSHGRIAAGARLCWLTGQHRGKFSVRASASDAGTHIAAVVVECCMRPCLGLCRGTTSNSASILDLALTAAPPCFAARRPAGQIVRATRALLSDGTGHGYFIPARGPQCWTSGLRH